ncbi:hypothetical protein QAD02_001480 [Eretmocerus hayati]|uniref:Uncharacterized protein n=1 Tax=Eretmocerus hayati TaxID=131215 RepID=A0ACC2NGK5_9HYME|nr:hypothetical protein QAD02_001480 [Eretmocerus hayati]
MYSGLSSTRVAYDPISEDDEYDADEDEEKNEEDTYAHSTDVVANILSMRSVSKRDGKLLLSKFKRELFLCTLAASVRNVREHKRNYASVFAKHQLSELCQRKNLSSPTYVDVSLSSKLGKNHRFKFVCSVKECNVSLTGEGESKNIAIAKASQKMYHYVLFDLYKSE